MPDNQSYDSAYVGKLVCTTSNQSEDMLVLRNHVTITSDADCFVNFDKEVTTNGRFLIKANIAYKFDVPFSRLNYLASGAANIYIMASI